MHMAQLIFCLELNVLLPNWAIEIYFVDAYVYIYIFFPYFSSKDNNARWDIIFLSYIWSQNLQIQIL